MVEIEAYFDGKPDELFLFQAIQRMIDSIGESSIRVTKTQISFRNRITFAVVWLPSKVRRSKNAPMVLTILLRRHVESPRWKEAVVLYPGRYVYHLEIRSEAELDEQVRDWLSEAWFVAS